MPYSIDALAGKLILVAEDEYPLADLMVSAIKSAGGEVLGPYATNADALQGLAGSQQAVHGAALNIVLADGESYPLAEEISARNIPFLFACGSGASALPHRFSSAPLIAKPYSAHGVVQAMIALLSRL